MASYNLPSNATLSTGNAISQETIRALAANPIAIAEGAVGAPRIVAEGLAYETAEVTISINTAESVGQDFLIAQKVGLSIVGFKVKSAPSGGIISLEISKYILGGAINTSSLEFKAKATALGSYTLVLFFMKQTAD